VNFFGKTIVAAALLRATAPLTASAARTAPGTLLILLLAALISASSVANAQQPSISMSTDSTGKSRTFLAGELTISQDITAVLHAFDNPIFTCTLVNPIKKGDVVAAMVSDDQAWSIDKTQMGYPILGMMKSSDGEFHSAFPAVLKVKIAVKPGTVLHSGKYNIEATQSIKAGASIPVFLVDNALLSINASRGIRNGSKAQPFFMVFASNAKPDEQRAVIEAWRIEKNHVSL